MSKFDFQKFKIIKSDESESVVGFLVPEFMIPFQDTFYKSSYEIFSKFLKQHNKVKQWMIFTDYVIGDRNKSNDVITSVLMSYVFPIDMIQYIIKSIQPKDIKKTKK